MEQIDQAQAARVWQRVKGAEPPRSCSPVELYQQLREDGAVFYRLSRRMKGREAAILQRLYEQSRSHAMVLRGLCALAGQEPTRQEVSGEEADPRSQVRRCLARMLRRQRLYAANAGEGEYAGIYAQLAREEALSCRRGAELLGLLET